jgi:hypothetical protein
MRVAPQKPFAGCGQSARRDWFGPATAGDLGGKRRAGPAMRLVSGGELVVAQIRP